VIHIVVSQRSEDWHACIEGSPGKWKCAKNINRAVSAVMRNHRIERAQVILNPPFHEHGIVATWIEPIRKPRRTRRSPNPRTSQPHSNKTKKGRTEMELRKERLREAS
jgi:hypothetical protein